MGREHKGNLTARGFTLIEVLTVIAIISILAALALPVIVRAKAVAKQSACMSNLRQLGDAMSLYMGDGDDVFPHALDPSDRWASSIWLGEPEFYEQIPFMPLLSEVLQPYSRSHELFKCPSDSGMMVLERQFPTRLQAVPSLYEAYGSSYFFRTELGFKLLSQSSLASPSQVNLLFDGAGHWHAAERSLTGEEKEETAFEVRRSFRYNCLYGDIHTRSVTYDQMTEAWNTRL